MVVTTRRLGLPRCDICGEPSEILYHCSSCGMRYCAGCGQVEDGEPTVCTLCIDAEEDSFLDSDSRLEADF